MEYKEKSATLLHSINETCRLLGYSGRNAIYLLIQNGEIEMVKLGRRSFITHESLIAFVDKLKGENE